MTKRNSMHTAFANLILRVEKAGGSWIVRILDLAERELLHERALGSLLSAKAAAVDFALARLFGPTHGKDAAAIAETLSWTQQ